MQILPAIDIGAYEQRDSRTRKSKASMLKGQWDGDVLLVDDDASRPVQSEWWHTKKAGRSSPVSKTYDEIREAQPFPSVVVLLNISGI
jgi:hypothetical protein